jgi:hypothetical protein
MAVEVAQGCRGDIGPYRVPTDYRGGGQRAKEGTLGFRRGQMAVEGSGPWRNRGL